MISKCSCMEVAPNLIVESTLESRIVLDIRDPLQYEKSHIKDSVNLMTSSLLLRRLQRGSLNIVSLLPENVVVQLENERCDSIVLCDESSTTLEMSRNLSIIATALKKSYPKKNVCFLMSKYCITFHNVNKTL
jgi:Rhodanese-like domain.